MKIIKKAFITLFTLLMLQGCVALVGGTAAVGTTAALIYDRRPIKQAIADGNTSYRIKQALDQDDAINDVSHIGVATYNGNVLIVGQTPTAQLKQRIQAIAATAPDIKKLYNEVSIQSPISMSARTKDTWITTEIKAALLKAPNLHSGQFSVITENRVVYLMGVVTKNQAKVAIAAIKRISGVRRIVTAFDYPKSYAYLG